MANAILDTLTIDGVAMDTHDANETSTGQQTANVPANTTVTGASLQITKKGVYALAGAVRFTDATSTGAGVVLSSITKDGTAWAIISQRPPNQYGVFTQLERVVLISSVPVTIGLTGFSDKARNNCTFNLVITKLIALGGGS